MGSEILAYFDSSHDAPEEILMAADFIPYKILGDVKQSNEPADQYLANFFCPAARSFLTEALKKSKEWAGILVAHGCDATNRHYDVWKMHVDTQFIHWFNTPMNMNEPARIFFKAELQRLINTIEKKLNRIVSQQKIQEAIKLSNQIKTKLREASQLRAVKDIPNADYFKLVVDCVQQDKDAILNLLDDTIADWNQRRDFPSDMKKILLTGSDVTYVEWMKILEEAGLRVVRDDLSIGERYFAINIPETLDPLDGIIDYHFDLPTPATRNPPDLRLNHLLKILKETHVDGIVSQNLKFCEPYAFDAVFTTKALKEKGYSVIHLEREFSPAFDQQLITRLEAFREIL